MGEGVGVGVGVGGWAVGGWVGVGAMVYHTITSHHHTVCACARVRARVHARVCLLACVRASVRPCDSLSLHFEGGVRWETDCIIILIDYYSLYCYFD